MTRDTFDRFQPPERGLFGDNESVRGNESVKSDLVDLLLHYRSEKPLALAVSQLDSQEWIWLPKSQIEFVRKPQGQVSVTMPQWLAKDKGLV